MKKILNKADISAALVCLKGESQTKGALFTLRSFMLRHSLDGSFRTAVNNFQIYSVPENRWIYQGLITPELIDKVFDFIKNDEIDYKQETENYKRKKNKTRLIKTLNKYDIDNSEIYIRADVYSQKIPMEIITKGIDVGNGIFIVNLKHLEEYETANAAN